MTKPANFPERKRQRQLGALARIQPFMKAKVGKVLEIEALCTATATSKRDVKTKKIRA